MKMHFKPMGVENDHKITEQTEADFLILLQRAVLLGLKENGCLTEMQQHQAEENLMHQYRESRNVRSGLYCDD